MDDLGPQKIKETNQPKTCLDRLSVGSLVLTHWMFPDFGSLRDSCNLSFNFWLSSRAFGDVALGSGWWGGIYSVRF